MNRIETKQDKRTSEYITESARYKAQRCEEYPLRSKYLKVRGNRIIEVNHQLNQYKQRACGRLTHNRQAMYRAKGCFWTNNI